MVGYNDTYNRALTARSNALQRRKGQMIDRLNGSGRGDADEEDDDDYLSEDGMEGGGAYEDDYEDEMVGGSFEEASREVGGMRTGGRKMRGGFLPFLAAAAAPVVGSLLTRLFGGAYTGGKRQIKAAMLRDLKMGMNGMKGSARFLPAMRDIAFNVGSDVMKDARYRPPMVAEGGRATGGFLPMLAPLAMMAAPHIGSAIGRMFGLGRNSPIMRGEGFFDWVKNAASDVGNFLAPVGRVLAPIAESALPALGNIAKDAALNYAKKKVGLGRNCCSACNGSGKMSPYDLAYGGAMSARTTNAATHRQSEDRDLKNAFAETIHDPVRLDKEKRYALGAGGKRLYMKGGVGGQLAPMGQESMFGYDNNEQPYGLLPPRNVASRGYIQGGRRFKLNATTYGLNTPDAMEGEGQHYLTPVDQMRPTVGGMRTGGGASAWINHVKAYASKHGVSYKEALSKASATYRK